MSLLLAAAAAASVAALPVHFPIDSIARGQQGECYTVFEGTTIEPFPFVVKGLMRNYLGPGRHLVLTKLLGEKATFSGVVAGMSGSPCWIDGKLVGALAYAFAAFAKEPIAGITPIDSMLETMRLPEEPRPWRLSHREEDFEALQRGTAVASASPSGAGPQPIATPLMLGGVPPRVVAHFEPWLRSVGFEPIAGGQAGPASSLAPKELVPGGSITAVLIRGDVDIAATGTVTYVDGKTVLAFGHPFMSAGAVSFPMASADILNTMVSAMRSFKMSATGPILGEITQDRLTAIGGTLGPAPKMIPIHGSVNTRHGKAPFAVEIARDLVMSPRLVAMALTTALTGRVEATERGTVRLDGEIKVAGYPAVPVRNVYAAERDGGLLSSPATEMARAFAALWDTPFGLPAAMELRVDATVDPEPVEESIEALYVDRPQVHPGETVEIAVRLRRQGGGQPAERVVERFKIVIPRAWARREIGLAAAGFDGAERLAQDVGGAPHPTEYGQIGKHLAQRRTDGNVYLMVVREGASVHAAVDNWAFLPASVVATMSGDPSKQNREVGLAWEERRARPGVVSGMARVTVQVLAH